jgi:gamma-glutamyltranspeptidase / glutathione hydrolase
MRKNLALALALALPVTAHAQAGRSTVYAPNGVIATSQPLATTAGLQVLQNGGNAIDAAVTAAIVLSLTEPDMTGLGGDLFAIVWSAKDKKLYGLNASGRSGSLMTLEELTKRGRRSISGVEAVTVPGALSGWNALLERFGTLKLKQALEPTIKYAEQGFPVTPIIADDWADNVTKLKRDPGATATFLLDGERAPKPGEWFHNPDYAKTLRSIAAGGPGVLYGGQLGKQLADGIQKLGGFITLDDLKAHQISWVEPMSAPFRGYRLWELGPHNQGIAALEMLRILDGYDLKAMGHNSAKYLHHLIEAKKLAYADLAEYVSDPATMKIKPEMLISDEFIANRRKLIDPNKAAERFDAGAAITETETIYLTTSDAEGNMVSLINSNFDLFGSGVVIPGTGFPLQNRGAGFNLRAGHANVVAPRKLPFHTLVPAFVTRTNNGIEEPYMSFGVMGGAMQPQGHVQVLLNHLVFGMDIQPAIDAPRFRHNNARNVSVERQLSPEVRTQLSALGHEIREAGIGTFGGAQAIIKLVKGWAAGSDPRKDGMAAGH